MILEKSYQRDLEDIKSIDAVPTLLDVICQSTGMGFAAVARVTADKWLTCGVLDHIAFGLAPGDELEVRTTICNEIRQAEQMVVIDNVSTDTAYCNHHTPLKYGFKSYISVPIVRKDGSFFGTLCAIDPEPRELNNSKIIGMFNLYAELVAFHLDAIESLREKDLQIKTKDKELASYGFVSSHDLQEPLRKIQILTDTIREKEYNGLTTRAKDYFLKINGEASRMARTLKDLLAYSNTESFSDRFEFMDLTTIINRVQEDLKKELENIGANVTIGKLGNAEIVPLQMEQLFLNLFSNAIKFRSQERILEIHIDGITVVSSEDNDVDLLPDTSYCKISFNDNGIGFDPKNNETIFGMFRRLKKNKMDKSTGIGLAIARRIAENHGGRITASGTAGKGASFSIYLPVEH